MTTSDIQTVHGPMRIINEDIWISRSLRELGEYSPSELKTMYMVLGLLSRGRYDSVVIDAGAFIGDLTIPLSRFCKKVYAFEPQEPVREILKHNLDINGITNVEVLSYALGNACETITYDSENIDVNPGGTQMGTEGAGSVEMVSLDSLGIDVDFLKADVEGMEIPLLAGAMNTLERTRCPLFMERDTVIHDQYRHINDILQELGYDVYPMDFPFYRADNPNRSPNTFGHTVSHMTLAIPSRGLPGRP